MSTIIFAPITLTNVSGTVVFGNVQQIAPQSSSNTTGGAGGTQVGDSTQSNAVDSSTNRGNTGAAINKGKKKRAQPAGRRR